MTSSVYQTTIEELEAILSPRVVSRSLQEGLRNVDKSPQTVTYDDIEKILTSHIYKQLQVAMPVSEAKTVIESILGKLKNLEEEAIKKSQIGQVLEQQASNLSFLQERLKPFNLYFEWSEVQKLRALVQLLDTEHAAGNEASKLINDAREQLHVVEQKLEDNLVSQARELGDLDTTFDIIKSLGGPKVRRFENLINQIRNAQNNRQLAQAELERARKLSLDLRKLMESSVVVESVIEPDNSDFDLLLSVDETPEAPAAPSLDVAASDTQGDNAAELSAKLLALDISNETRELSALRDGFTMLLAYKPELAAKFAPLEQQLQQNNSVSSALAALREELAEAASAQRQALSLELQAMQAQTQSFETDSKDIQQNLHITLDILESSLPPLSDIDHLRRLYQFALQKETEAKQLREAEQAALAAQLAEQADSLEKLTASLTYYKDNEDVRDEFTAFAMCVSMLSDAHSRSETNPEALQKARQAAAQLEQAVAERTATALERERAQVRNLVGQLQALPTTLNLASAGANLSAQFTQVLNTLEREAVGQSVIEDCQAALRGFETQLRSDYGQSLQLVAQEAELLDAGSLVEQVKQAELALEQSYPKLEIFEQLLAQAKENKRGEQVKDLYALEKELRGYRTLNSVSLQSLNAFISEAQKQLEAGQLIPGFDEAWSLLDDVKQENERRSANFVPRVTAALQDYEEVSKLNTEDSNKAGRILTHLNAQAESFGRTSVGMQQELEAALTEAETLIESLKEQLEATRAIAGQLVNTNLLDNLFGGSSLTESPQENMSIFEEPAAQQGVNLQSASERVNNWINSFRQEDGVNSLLLIESAQLSAGFTQLDSTNLSAILAGLELNFNQLGQELSLGKQNLSVIEMLSYSVISAWATPQAQVILILDQPALLNALLHKLRRDLAELSASLEGAPSR